MRALSTLDNVGVQYGLKALLAGTITAEEFVTLNEKVGGFDADYNRSAGRTVADAAALPIAYRAGILSSGKNLGKVAIIDSRDEGSTGSPIHDNWRSFEERARLDADAGSHANQVIWRYGSGLLPTTAPQVAAVTTFSFTTMDTWLSSLLTSAPKATLNAERTQAQVVAAKPAAAVDFCYLTADANFTTKITDQATCDADTNLKVFTSPHQVAGGPQAENILKCQLKPVVFSDYTGITFTAGQQARLNAGSRTRGVRLGQARRRPAGPGGAADVRRGPRRRAAAGGTDVDVALTAFGGGDALIAFANDKGRRTLRPFFRAGRGGAPGRYRPATPAFGGQYYSLSYGRGDVAVYQRRPAAMGRPGADPIISGSTRIDFLRAAPAVFFAPPHAEDRMTAAHEPNEIDGPHEGPIKTPKQLILAVLYAFVVPIFGIILCHVRHRRETAGGR